MIGGSIFAAEDALRELVSEIGVIDTVEGMAPKEIPRTACNVYLGGARDITAELTRGTAGVEGYKLDVVVDVRAAEGEPYGSREQARAQMKAVLDAIDAKLAEQPRLKGTVTLARLEITDTDHGYWSGAWGARAYAFVGCTASANGVGA